MITIVYIMVVWFLILLFSDRDYLLCSIVILLASISNILIVDVFGITEQLTYVAEQGFLIKLDGLAAIVLTSLYTKDRAAFKMSLLLAFSVMCHTMLIYDLTIQSSFVSNLFYTWYDELIIIVGLLQMVITSDGITSALRNIWEHILRSGFYSWGYSKGIFTHKRSGERT